MTKEIKNSIKLVIFAFFTAMAITGIIHCFTFEAKMSEAFKNGYEQAILDAELVEMDESGYTISFGGELHSYTFD